MIIQFIVSLFATLSFAELFGAPKKELFSASASDECGSCKIRIFCSEGKDGKKR